MHLCEVAGGELTLSHEGLALRYWSLHEVPRWLGGTKKRARAAYALWASEGVTIVSDCASALDNDKVHCQPCS